VYKEASVPMEVEPSDLQQLPIRHLWRSDEPPLSYFRLRRRPNGLIGTLPPTDETYPRYLMHLWPDGLLEYGVVLEPMFREDDPSKNRVIASRAMAEYSHDFLLLAAAIFRARGYSEEVIAQVRLDHIRGHVLLVDPLRVWSTPEVIEEDVVEANWQGAVADLEAEGAKAVTKDALDMLFLAAGLERGAYFFDANGQYNP
jgi:hypothetical protein